MRFSRLAAIAGASVLVLGVASCSSHRGQAPASNGGGMGAGQANTPRVTVAMITHEVPGDSFWDLIRKGAQAAADKDNIELRYSNDPEAPNQANLVQSAIDSGVKGIALTLAKPDAMAPAVKAAIDKNIPVVAFNSGFDNWKAMGVQEYFGQDEKLAGVAAGERLNKDGAKKVICVIQEQGQVALESRCAGVKAGLQRGVRDPERQQQGHAVGGVDDHRQAAAGSKSVDHVVALGAPIALAAVQSVGNAGSSAQGRHLRHQRGARRRDQEGRREVGGRPAAVPAGIPGDRLAVAVHQQQEPDRWRPSHSDGPVVHRQDEHRRRRRAGQVRNPLSPRRRE